MMPFPLSDSDHAQFMSDIGWTALAELPQWGGIIEWNGRYILVYQRPDSGYSLTDISGGIPDAGVPGGMIPIQSFIRNISKTQISPLGAFLYSLPANFMQVAKENAIAAAQGVADIIEPLVPDLTILAVIAVAALIFIYAPRPHS